MHALANHAVDIFVAFTLMRAVRIANVCGHAGVDGEVRL